MDPLTEKVARAIDPWGWDTAPLGESHKALLEHKRQVATTQARAAIRAMFEVPRVIRPSTVYEHDPVKVYDITEELACILRSEVAAALEDSNAGK